MKFFTATLLTLMLSSVATACNIPVFRYALERWRPDICELIVFHDGSFTESQKSFLSGLDAASVDSNGIANMKIVRQHVSESMDDSIATLWAGLQSQDSKLALPYVVVRSMVGRGKSVNSWRGSIDDVAASGLLDSPIRRELTRRLVTGDSAVWLVLKSSNAERNSAVTTLLTQQLTELGNKIPLPEGIGLPGSELFSDIPLLMKFSVLEIDPSDPAESYLVNFLHGMDPDSKLADQPLVVPVFGRGRALEVIPASKVDAGLIEDLTLFLCGACSCQVKDMNPGFDLLLAKDWNTELFGEDADDVAEKMKSAAEDIALPELVLIPPGRKSAETTQVAKNDESAVSASAESDSAHQSVDGFKHVPDEFSVSAPATKSTGFVVWVIIGLIGFAALAALFSR